GAQPSGAVMAAATGVGAHGRRAAEAGDPALRGCRAVALRVDLQCAAGEEVAGILSGDLRKRAVRAQIAVRPDRKHVGVARDVAFHAEFGAKAIDAVDEGGSIAGIRVGCRFSTKCRAILPFSPRSAAKV